ncbi:hypothetical protein MTO96_043247 [Rhipicephalus appendiculatus]
MDEEEAEQAAASATPFNNENAQVEAKDGSVSGHQASAVDDAVKGQRQESATANAEGVDSEHLVEESAGEQRGACSVSTVLEAVGKVLAVTEASAEEMDAETTPAKRRHEDAVAVPQGQRPRQIEASVGVGAKKKTRSAVRVRASSLSRGDTDANF